MSQVYPETSGNPNFPGGPPKYSTGTPQNQYYGMPPPPPPPAYNAPQPQQGWSYPQPYPGTPFAQPQATVLPPVQNQVVILDGSGGQPIYYRATESYAGPIVLSCFVLWCFNFLFGLIAFILAVLANNSAVSDKKGARRLGRASYIVSGTGILVTAIIIGVTVGVIVGGTSAAVSSTVNTVNYSTCNYYIDGACYLYRSYYYSYCSGYAGYDGYCYYN